MELFEVRHSNPMLAWNPPDYWTTLVHESRPPLRPLARALDSMRLRPLSAAAAPQNAGSGNHRSGGDSDADPWGFRGPIFGP